MKNKLLKLLIATFTILMAFIYITPTITYIKNKALDYNQEVYLGGDNIVIDFKTESDKNAITDVNEYATIGTLTYITKSGQYGAVAHQISNKRILSGSVYSSPVTSVIKSTKNEIGEKNVDLGYISSVGNISIVNQSGIYGTYTKNNQKELYQVGMPKEIKLGNAYIVTNIENDKVEKFQIEIINVYYYRNTHNIYFKIKDQELLNKTGGIIKGMSGSPIIQNGKIIGAISHVEGNDTSKGYGLFITNML